MPTPFEQLLENARHNEQVMSKMQCLEMALIATADFTGLLPLLLTEMQQAFALDAVHLHWVDPTSEVRGLLASIGLDEADYPELHFIASAFPLSNQLGPDLSTRLALFVPHQHADWLPGHDHLGSVAFLPLVRQGHLMGCLVLGSHDPERFSPALSTDFLARLAAIAGVCLENVFNHERLKRLGLTDALTGVHNRRYFDQRLDEEITRSHRQGSMLAGLFLDIDFFKRINDTWGHPAGDAVLQEVARRVKEQLRITDTLARYGGEEFAALLVQADASQAVRVAERIRAAVAASPVCLGEGMDIPVTLSIGVSTFHGLRAQENASQAGGRLLHEADTALYQAKEGGRNRVVCQCLNEGGEHD
ncbi:hypothetical protein BXU06_07840 [Aquaspirillum sp. LM1]|uniref:DUF484 family protein n=1 Tax=Aquaspirillum sp. LM1 TaxID=1938604 RepID=UPI000983C269|nr:DUF484 family protein [Aquaspirillum sp. LM1]AQR64986.1 hypothetical protein BXU06_07840 [Aquaspirillum sp. LM1]